jgi:hypothetical protein
MPVLTSIAVAVCSALLGGWEWTLVCSIVLLAVSRRESTIRAILYTAAVGLFWLAIFRWTGDRRMFFPYSMQYAVQMACLTRSATAGGCIVLLFLLIRIGQSATLGVLAVEIVVAAAVLAISFYVHGPKMRGAEWRARVSAVGSVLAFAGLAF